jgi:hypothetical protein
MVVAHGQLLRLTVALLVTAAALLLGSLMAGDDPQAATPAPPAPLPPPSAPMRPQDFSGTVFGITYDGVYFKDTLRLGTVDLSGQFTAAFDGTPEVSGKITANLTEVLIDFTVSASCENDHYNGGIVNVDTAFHLTSGHEWFMAGTYSVSRTCLPFSFSANLPFAALGPGVPTH